MLIHLAMAHKGYVRTANGRNMPRPMPMCTALSCSVVQPTDFSDHQVTAQASSATRLGNLDGSIRPADKWTLAG